MNLTDLEPRWFVLEEGGPIVGVGFLCPHCREQRLAILFQNRGEEVVDTAYIRARRPEGFIWTVEGPEDFAVLTVTPSIDASHLGHWHGFITNGEIR